MKINFINGKSIIIGIVIVLSLLSACAQEMDFSSNSEGSNKKDSNSYISARDNDDEDPIRQASLPVDCPVGLVNGLTLDEEFGPGTSNITRCLHEHNEVYSVYPLNKLCNNDSCSKPYALGNINNAINDYEITNGLVEHVNYEISAVIYSGGALMAINNNAVSPFPEQNPFQEQIEGLLAKGVHIYLCQNTARGKGIMTEHLIPGIKFVTSGVTAIADFQLKDFALVQP